jgi:hypothetical protein
MTLVYAQFLPPQQSNRVAVSHVSYVPCLPLDHVPSMQATSKLLLLIARIGREGKITAAQKNKLKDLVIARNATVISALEVFEFDSDLEELIDTLTRICKCMSRSLALTKIVHNLIC